VSGALLCGALSLLLWPTRRRLPVTGLPGPRRVWTAWLSAPRWAGAPAAALAVAVVVGALSTPLVAVLAGGAALAAGRAAGARSARAAEERRARVLAELLGSLAADLRAGRPTAEAAAAAVAGCPDGRTGEALARALRAADVPGAEPGDAGGPAQALARLAAGVRLSERTGCSLAAVACAVEDDLRARLRLQEDLRTATAAPRASALLLAGLPLLALAMGSGIGADPWHVLTGTPVGQLLLVVGVALEAAGLAWSARLVRRAVP
jgi:tight adherence protein B